MIQAAECDGRQSVEGSNIDQSVVKYELEVFLVLLEGEDLQEIVLFEAQSQVEDAVVGERWR